MSLIADVSVNRVQDVGYIAIQRIEGGTDPDDTNTYEYTIYENERQTGARDFVCKGQVMHRYGDGGLRLLLKALLDAERHL